MAPTTLAPSSSDLAKRLFYNYGVGRWVLLGVIIVAALLFMWIWVCARNRKRAKHGQPPSYATTWMGPAGGYFSGNNQAVPTQNQGSNGSYYAGAGNQQTQQTQQTQFQPPPPAYGTHPGSNNPYPQQSGVAGTNNYYGNGTNGNGNYNDPPSEYNNYHGMATREEYEMQDYPPPSSPPPAHAKAST
ncbi:uncharacterized protein V2V93DRAFT_368776 [Kockiozyma suomiensis]|uniref:uncharacterized protein n=1 Tax=Kockiozyma suomiensis TaxID=1337062 RepID=UPI003342E89D